MRFVEQGRLMYPSIAERHPEECARLGQAKAVEILTRALDRAFAQGFRAPHHASIFCDLTMMWGEDFGERLPWAKEVIAATQVPTDLRASELLRRSDAILVDRYLGDEPEPSEAADYDGEE